VAKTLIPFLIIEVFFSLNPIGWLRELLYHRRTAPRREQRQQGFPDAELSEFPYDLCAKILKEDNQVHRQLTSFAGDLMPSEHFQKTRSRPTPRAPWSGSDPAAVFSRARSPALQLVAACALQICHAAATFYLRRSLELFFPGAEPTFHIGIRYNPNPI
jgi:hypothetical protein